MPGKEQETFSTNNLASDKFYLPQEPCRCSAILKQVLAPFNGPGPIFQPAFYGSQAQTITLSVKISDNDACRLTDGTSLCERPSFKLIDGETLVEITTFPHKGVAWNKFTQQLTLHPQSDDPFGLHKVLLTAYLPSIKDVIQTVEIEYFINSPPEHQSSPLEKDDEDLPELEIDELHRKLSGVQGYCTNPITLLNLFNTAALAEQISFKSNNQNANTGCDGDVIEIDTGNPPPSYSWVGTKLLSTYNQTPPSAPQWWKVTFAQATTIKTTLFINRDDCCWDRLREMIVTFGNNKDVWLNPVCVEKGTMTDGGWYLCPTSMFGTTFGVYETTIVYVSFIEAMAYSQEAIQMNALSVSFLGTNDPTYPVTNALQKIVIIRRTRVGSKCIYVTAPTGGFATFNIKFKAQVLISGVVLLPGFSTTISNCPSYHTNVAIYSNTVGGTQQLCGVLANYYTRYGEIICNIQANEIILVQQTAAPYDLRFCGFGALSDCDCSKSSLDPLKFTTTPATPFSSVTSLSVQVTDSISSITFAAPTNISDTVSSVCGTADGFTKCGLRSQISFKDKMTGLAITVWPYRGWDWNSATSVLTLDPMKAAATSVLTASISLLNYPAVIFSQDITSTVLGGVINPQNTGIRAFIPKETLSLQCVINQESTLQLPIIIGVQYIVISNQTYRATVDGQTLTVISTSQGDIGTQILQMRAFSVSITYNFPVSVIFRDQTDLSALKDTSNNATNFSVSQTTNSESSQVLTSNEGTVFTANETDYRPQAYTNAPPKLPTLQISRVDSKGLFSLTFSEPMNLEALINPDYQSNRRLKTKKKTKASNIASDNSSDDTDLYLLSEKHLRITIKSDNATTPKFTWYAKNITSTKIKVQLVFQDPLYISSQPGLIDKLVITILPPALWYTKSLATGALPENPLRTEIKDLPPQSILGVVIESVESASVTMMNFGLSSSVGNTVVQIVLSGSMAQMWSMVNAQQIILSYQLLNLPMPANVILVMTNLANICNFDIFPTDKIMAFLFSFTPTDSPGVGFSAMGNETKSLTLYQGSAFLIMILIGLQYLFYSLVYTCRNYDKLLNWIEQKLRPGLFYGVLYVFFIQTYLNWVIGSALRLEQPKFVTPSDYFDFGLACAGVLITLVFPLYCFFFLKRNVNQLNKYRFKKKHGDLYAGFATQNALKRQASIQILAWFLLRRFLTGINLVYLRNQTIWIQLTLSMWLSLIDVCVKIHLSPYESKVGGIMEKLNDVCVLICSYFPYLFTDLIPTQEDKYYIGWYYNGIIGMLLGANLLVMVMTAYQNIKKKITGMLNKFKHEKATEKQNANKKVKEEAMKKLKPTTAEGIVAVGGLIIMTAAVIPPQTADFQSDLYVDQQVRVEQSKAYKRYERKKKRDAALNKKIVKQRMEEIEEVDEISSIEMEERSVKQPSESSSSYKSSSQSDSFSSLIALQSSASSSNLNKQVVDSQTSSPLLIEAKIIQQQKLVDAKLKNDIPQPHLEATEEIDMAALMKGNQMNVKQKRTKEETKEHETKTPVIERGKIRQRPLLAREIVHEDLNDQINQLILAREIFNREQDDRLSQFKIQRKKQGEIRQIKSEILGRR